ncbi:fatty acyl-AMP ligase [Mycolicibacterium brumae]|uniref:Fatty-acid--CoA ligase n=1 Tax=Mycolicibacterium brumae TaxID=85968 RepID=A0A2G5PDX3_9MYCO|nr:fatty acyl-AMP ligase [Mycolicibacterium brumae]MCV7192812.1 AMP-binding protein [Mycolicibacterium brumae]PIB76516.1 fatty-acid--CoA ligase [Mycolicibacterium brumae]RWA23400.1 hypothetical protein MBRU_00855 [Mycolicibacterium brumae DSM 44177]UWW08668.1 fatty acyl-AMP ligase [Mycolicibacterium brumae]
MYPGLLQVDDCLDGDGLVVVPPTLTIDALIERCIYSVGEQTAYRYIDFSRVSDGVVSEITWNQVGVRATAVAAAVQRHAHPRDRVAVLAPQGLDYITGFFGAIKAGTVAVPLFAPELAGQAERLDTAMRDARPSVVLTTSSVRDLIVGFLDRLTGMPRPQVILLDELPDTSARDFNPVHIDIGDVCHLQYSGGATRAPVGIEITHRAMVTNLVQMILAIDLHDRNTHGVSWLPLYHDMGLSMIGFPTVYGGHTTLMSPTAFIRRPQRWIKAMSDEIRLGRPVVTAAPNLAYDWAAQRGLPDDGETVDLSNVTMIIGSEPVSYGAIAAFTDAFAPHGLPASAIKPSYGIAEATLMVATTGPQQAPAVVHFDRAELGRGRAAPVNADDPAAVPHVSCGRLANNLQAVIVDPAAGAELPDGSVGEIWLHGANIGRGYWRRRAESEQTFGARLTARDGAHSRARAVPTDARWLRTGDLGFFLNGELFVPGRLIDLITIDGRAHYPDDIELTAADASSLLRRGYIIAFSVPDGSGGQKLVLACERAPGTARKDPQPGIDAVRAAVAKRHGLSVADVLLLPGGAVPRTTSGKLRRRACRESYLDGTLGKKS